MQFALSKDSSINTELSNEAGEVVYSVATPWKLPRRTSTISKHTHDEENGEERKEEIARIHWHAVQSSRLVYKGQIHEISDFMKSSRLGTARTFQASDGKAYKWNLAKSTAHLEIDDDPKTTVAKYIQSTLLGRKAALRVEESVLPMLDLVVATWVYAEEHRREMQEGSSN